MFILHKSIAGRYRPVSYPDGPITARYRFIKNAYWVCRKNAGWEVLKSARWAANSVELIRHRVMWRLIWDCTDCSDSSAPILRVNTQYDRKSFSQTSIKLRKRKSITHPTDTFVLHPEKRCYRGKCEMLTLVLLNRDIPFLCKECTSRSVGQLIWIYTVWH